VDGIAFISTDTVQFFNTVGSEATLRWFRIDGTEAGPTPFPEDVGGKPGGTIVPTFGVNRLFVSVFDAIVPGVPENADLFPVGQIREPFRVSGEHRVQLVSLRRAETRTVAVRPRDVLLFASADPFGDNPGHNCQIFRVGPFGGGLRQLTRFGGSTISGKNCLFGVAPGCANYIVDQDESPRDFVFYSDCDPLGSNPDGGQVFAMRWDGSRLRQLTHAAGARYGADGLVEVEIPGPVSRGGR
jgi:hypothetical protein